MSEADDAAPLIKARKLRAAAYDLVREDVDWLRQGLAERPVGTRVKDAAVERLADTAETAAGVAAENKAVIGATVAALGAWFLRGPIMRGISRAGEKLNEWRG